MQNFAREWQSHWHKNLSPHVRYVAIIPCESLTHKSNTFHINISTLHVFISITFTETSIDETIKTQQKVRGSKCIFKMSTNHTNTCIQTTATVQSLPRWRCAWSSSLYSLSRHRHHHQQQHLSTSSHHGSASSRLSLEAYPRCCSPPDSNLAN